MNKGQTEMKIIVQKFGGTSIHTPELREKAALKLKEAYEEGYSPVAVVSAMGRAGAPYATDTLISIAKTEYEHLDSRNLDILMSTGEIISTVIMTQALRKLGLKAVAVTGWQAGIITDDRFGDATIKRVETKKILSYLEKGIIVNAANDDVVRLLPPLIVGKKEIDQMVKSLVEVLLDIQFTNTVPGMK
jgi:aspartate kinase